MLALSGDLQDDHKAEWLLWITVQTGPRHYPL
jgi:hypothetical protein